MGNKSYEVEVDFSLSFPYLWLSPVAIFTLIKYCGNFVCTLKLVLCNFLKETSGVTDELPPSSGYTLLNEFTYSSVRLTITQKM